MLKEHFLLRGHSGPFRAVFFFLFAAVSLPLAGQETIFAPFVSRLEAELKNNLLRLSWLDSKDARGPVYIFRSSRPFTDSNDPALVDPVTVPYGTQSWVDEPDNAGTVYYFVAASDEQGRRYNIFIPDGNMAALGIEGGSRPPDPGIFGIEAAVEGEKVILSWRAAAAARSAILYRSSRPLRDTGDLLGAVIVQTGPVPPFTDFPAPGIPWYYAVVFEDELAGGSVRMIPGGNVTAEAVRVRPEAEGHGERFEMRSIPLPLVSITNAVKGADASDELGAPVSISPEAAKAASGFTTERGVLPPKQPRAFREDLQAPAGGEESTLRAIVQGSFAGRDWETSRTELIRYLSVPRSPLPLARAHFYLGQAWYFSENYREALIEFLAVQSRYPQEANEWIEDTLSRLIN
ncbi:MAG: hypothetical protein LBG42_00505 [Treponema sp.]|nr:hypothetical protein [Treponema sp.]